MVHTATWLQSWVASDALPTVELPEPYMYRYRRRQRLQDVPCACPFCSLNSRSTNPPSAPKSRIATFFFEKFSSVRLQKPPARRQILQPPGSAHVYYTQPPISSPPAVGLRPQLRRGGNLQPGPSWGHGRTRKSSRQPTCSRPADADHPVSSDRHSRATGLRRSPLS